MSHHTRAEAERERTRWARALCEIAKKYGRESTIGRMLGSLAWGRHEGEPKPDEKVHDVVWGCGYLRGYSDAMLRACEIFRVDGENDVRIVWQRVNELEARERESRPR